ncbi:MAG TPA: GNAT family protein [Bryobacteraceae bacterium]|nr:GNAT family protein [Bryobacteraceae bacterium]
MNISPVTLEGHHVRLVPLESSHASGLWEAGQDPEVWRFTTSRISSEADMAAYVATALDEQTRGLSIPFSTIAKASGAIAGTTRFANIVREHKRVEIGWTFVGPAWQRTAINTEAKYLMLTHAFNVWGCNRVELKTNALNVRSREAMLRIGCTEEGTLRRHMINPDGTTRDTVYFSIIAEEWPEKRARLEQMLQRP